MRNSWIAIVIGAAVGMAAAPAVAAVAPAGTEQADAPGLPARYRDLMKALRPVRGDVRIAQADAVLHLGDRYNFLDAAQARRVLTEG